MSGINVSRRRPHLPDLNLPYNDDDHDDDHQPINLDLVLHPPYVDHHPNFNASDDSNQPMPADDEVGEYSDDGDESFEADDDGEESFESDDDGDESFESDDDEDDYDDELDSIFEVASAAREVVEGLPSVVVEEEGEVVVCAVCMEDVAAAGTAKQLPCLHRYHEGCILHWLTLRNTCPLCRYALPTDEDLRHGRRG